MAAARFESMARLGWGAWIGAVLFGSLVWRARANNLRLILLLFTACFFLGAARMGDRAFRPPPDFLRAWVVGKQTVNVWLEAEEYCQTDGKISRFRARLLGYFEGPRLHPASADVLVRVGDAECSASPGRRFQTWGKFSFPKAFRNPFSFDYPRYLRLQGIEAGLFVKGERWLLPWGKAPGFFWSLAADIRRHLLALLERDLNPGPSRGVLEALLVGSQGGLTPEIENAFRATGLTHLLVVSGLHLTLVFLLFFLPIYLLFSLHEPWSESGRAKKGAMLAALGPTVLYAAVVGPGPSVARALMFSALAVFLFWRDWKWDVLSILLFSFGLSLACEPGALFDLSFQFSYLAVGMLFFSGRKIFLYFKNRIPRRSPARWGPLKWTATLLFTNLAINLALLPWMAEIFHEASAVAPLANLLFIPLFTFLIHPLSWMGALVDVLSSPGAGIFFRFLEFGLGRALRILEALASLPFASVLIPPLPRLFWAGYALLVAAFGLHPDWPRRWMAAGCLLMAVGIGWRSAKNEAGAGMLSLTMLDVGQGESLLVRTPEGSALLIDGGGFPYSDFDLGRQVILPELLGKRAGRLRAMVLTHPDADHLKGLTAVARRWNVAEFWYPRTAQEDPNLAPLLQIVMEAGIPPRALRSGDRVEVDQVDFEVLWPEIGSEKVFSDNNRSLVLKMCYREVCFYLMGDLEEEAEELLAFGPRRGAFRILKVGHHGSRTSTNYDFLQKLHPALALVSAGQDNRFHHPHPEVLKRLEESKVPLLRTDRQGQIEIRTDGRLVFYRTYSGERGMLVNSAPVPSWWVSTRRWVFE